jgi:hypothetical protein
MVFIVSHDGKLKPDPETKSPEIYRMTPYEFAVTADPVQEIVTCVHPIVVRSSTISTTVRNSIRSLPASMIGR